MRNAKYLMPLTMVSAASLWLVPMTQAADTVATSALHQCADIDAPTDRLACYDHLAGRAPSTTAIVPTTAIPAKPAAPPKEAFGLYSAEHPEPLAPAITAKLLSAHSGADGHTVITLDGGQVWQLDTEDPLLFPGDSVTIRRAALGSFMMSTPSGRVDRLRRLR